MPIAFFDLDRTLVRVNTGQLWVRQEWREGRISWWQSTRAMGWIAGYHLGFSRMESVLEEAIASLKGSTEAELEARTRSFYAREVAETFRPGARAVVAAHQAKGDTLALLTSASSYLAEAVGEVLGIPHALCNRFEVVGGQFTGKPVSPLCFGPGKLVHAQRLAAELGEDLGSASFYTDSYSDFPVMDAVGHPVAVNPDPTLRRVALKRGWEVVDWG